MRRRQRVPSEYEKLIEQGRAEREQRADVCAAKVVPVAIEDFRSRVHLLDQLPHDDRLRQASLLHRESICSAYVSNVNDSLFTIPLVREDRSKPHSADRAFPWLVDIVRDHAAAMQMTEVEFGRMMAADFSYWHNDAVKSYNSLVTMSPFAAAGRGPLGSAGEFHNYAKTRSEMSPEQLNAFDDAENAWAARKNAAQEVALLWKNFCIAYSRYDPVLAASLR